MTDQTRSCGRRALTIALAAAISSICIVAALPTPVSAATMVFSATGADAASIQSGVDAFRALLGANNGNAPGSFGLGRREINWDGGGAAAPFTAFAGPNQVFAFRGNITVTPNTAFSGAPLPRFSNLNPAYADQFTTFSAPRLFGLLDGVVAETVFNVPGDATRPATTSAFGIVFTDVDIAGLTRIEAFDVAGESLGIFGAEAFNRGLSFLGIAFDTPVIASIRINLGTTPLGLGLSETDRDIDIVAMDDFIFAEPVATPAPGALACLVLGLGGLALRRARP